MLYIGFFGKKNFFLIFRIGIKIKTCGKYKKGSNSEKTYFELEVYCL